MLLDKNADFTAADGNGATALHYVAQSNFSETVAVFLSFDKIKDIPDKDGRTALMWASGKGWYKCLTRCVGSWRRASHPSELATTKFAPSSTQLAIKYVNCIFLLPSKKDNIVGIMKQNHTEHVFFSFFNPLKVTEDELKIEAI